VTLWLYIQSDLEERAEPRLTRAIRDGREAATPELALDNGGISTVACGYAESVGLRTEGGSRRFLTPPRSSESAARVRSAWEPLFAENTVAFEPFCRPVNQHLASRVN
jgi:hypothetical protein